MSHELFILLLFTVKSLIIVFIIFLLLIGVIAITSRGKEKLRGRITIKNLNEKFSDTKEQLLQEILSSDALKKFSKEKKLSEKKQKKSANTEKQKTVFVLN